MSEMIALKQMRYRHRLLRPGDRFAVHTPVEANLMLRLGNAKVAVEVKSGRAKQAAPKTEPEPKPVAAQPEPVTETEPEEEDGVRKPRKGYARRDLRAED